MLGNSASLVAASRSAIVIAALVGGLAALRPVAALAQARGNEAGSLELVDPDVFRACGDPRNLPFSNDKSEGFENKLAELFAAKLGKKLSYTYFPQATGFVRMTLGSYRCDVIMGFPQGDDQAQVTIPYYRTTYALITKRGSGLEDVTTIDDPRLKDKRIGVVAQDAAEHQHGDQRTFGPGQVLSVVHRHPCRFLGAGHDRRPQPGRYRLRHIVGSDGRLFRANRPNPPLVVVPLVKETTGPQMIYRIGMAVRPADQEWKRTLNKLITENQAEINKLLISYNIPILDEANVPITTETLSKRP